MNIPGARSPTLAASLLRPRTISYLLGDHGGAHRHDLMDETPMQTLAMRGQSPLAGGLASPRGKRALSLFPRHALLPPFLGPPARIGVVGVRGAPWAPHLALQSPHRLGIGSGLCADARQPWGAFS